MASSSQSNRILISAPQLPKPDQAAGDKRFVALLAMMAKNYHVDLHVLTAEGKSEGIKDSKSERAKKDGEECKKGGKEEEAAQTRHYTAQLNDLGIQVLPIAKNSFHRAVCKTEYQLCLYEFWPCYFWTARVLRYFQPWVKTIVDSVDLHFLREESALALGLANADAVTQNKRHELQAYKEADAVVVITREEEQTLRANNITKPIFVLPNINAISPRSLSRASIKERGRALIFIGGFQHSPNADGLLWFVNEIWSLIVQAAPDVTLTIIGSHPTPEVERLDAQPGIKVLGYVSDTAPYLDRAAISIAPIRFGAGMKGKVTEAMAAGLPIVTTSFGAQGLEVESGEQMMIADDPGLFAVHVIHLLANPELANAMGRKAQEHIASLCGPEIVGRQLDDMLHTLIPESISVRSHLEWRLKSALYTLPRLLKPKKL